MSRQQVRRPNTASTYRTQKPQAYVYGNTVRKIDQAPQRIPREKTREEQEREAREERRRREARRAARANQQKAMAMSPGYLLFLTAAVAMTLGVCALYLQLQADVSGRMRNVASLESQISDLRIENDAALSRIEASVDLAQVKQTAMDNLGMVYPGQDQIYYFEVETNDYMNQYKDIPKK